MSRSQGAANNGWPTQRHPAGEGDPRTGERPAQRPQTNQANQYVVPGQQAAGYPQGYGEPQAPAYGGPQQGYHYPQQNPQQPQYAPPPQAPAAHAQQPSNRQGLSSLDSARNAQPTQDFENFPRTQPPQYAAQPPRQAPAQRAPYGAPGAEHTNAGYRQAPQGAPQYAPRQAPPAYDQKWPPQAPAQSHGYGQDLGGYLPADAPFPANGNQPHMDPLQQADWAMPATSYGDPIDQPGFGRGQVGYDQAHGGALEPTYNQDEAGAYEAEEPRRVSWTMRIAGAVVVAIGLGYGLAQAYKAVLGSPPDSSPPVIESDASPAKERPLDPGGKQFSHTDSKVLGRLGDNGAPASEDRSAGLSESDASNGSRPVKTLVVGRDGSIEAPTGSAEAAPAHEEQVAVPGLTVVDAFGSAGQSASPPQQRAAPQPPPQQQAEAEPVVVNTKPRVNVKTTKVIPASTASLPDEQAEPVAPAAPKKQKVATAAPVAEEGATTSAAGANGYVVVLASVPASGSSRLDALRKFADLQQQYGTVLANKTPDVRETTLAGKGPYHRLLVGPPGSKSQANDLCTQLKASGYKDCWVTAY
jgi:hypothetical protein